MDSLEWTDKLSVHVSEIDDQHKKLFKLVNELEELHEQTETRISGKALVEMMDYVSEHFSLEERLMAEEEYPQLEAHKAKHKEFHDSTFTFLNAFKQRNGLQSNEIIHYLKDWIINHVISIDGKFGEFMADRRSKVR